LRCARARGGQPLSWRSAGTSVARGQQGCWANVMEKKDLLLPAPEDQEKKAEKVTVVVRTEGRQR
jgi:hypothetical protein